MHDYLLSGEWVRFAFVLGIAVSMVLYEKRHLTTGSIVVPGYIAVFILHPFVVIATFLNSLLTYAFVNKFLTKHFLLYGRTKFTILAITSTTIQTAMLRLSPSGNWLWESDIPIFIGVGYIVPALIAHDMARQGIAKTFRSVMLAALIVVVPIATALLLDLPGVNDLSPVDGFGSSAIALTWLPFAIALSVLASWGVAHNYGLRSGGFVGAAFVGMFMADPWQVVAAGAIATATYLIVAKVLMKHMILFGRRKFSSMLLVSSTIAWSGLWIGDRFLDATWQEHLGVGSLALTPLMLPGFLANDAQRTSPSAVVRGVCIAGTFAVTTTWWVQSMVTGITLHVGWKMVSLATFIILFHKQAEQLLAWTRRNAEAEAAEADTETVESGEQVDNAPVIAGPRPAEPALLRVLSNLTSPSPTPALAGLTPWSVWSEEHSDAAAEAESWLDAQLAAPRTSTTSDAPVYTAPSVLEDVLLSDRGIRRGPRRQPATESNAASISETPDAQREAQLRASGVSDNPPSEPDPDTPPLTLVETD